MGCEIESIGLKYLHHDGKGADWLKHEGLGYHAENPVG
jgi:hypothetical protein